MPYRKASKALTRTRRSFRRKFKRLPNVNQTRFFTPRNISTGVRYAVRGVNLMKTLINSELKRFDTNVSQTPTTTAAIQLLTPIDQGDDVGNRNGNSILAKYHTFGYTMTIDGAATGTIVRIIVFTDGDNDGQTPTAAEVLENSTLINSAHNRDYTARFTVLHDKTYCMSINSDRVIQDKVYTPLNFHIKYITGTGSTGFGKNNIWYLYMSNEATNAPIFLGYSRLAFYDN